jgi:DNA recombination protein RmuC
MLLQVLICIGCFAVGILITWLFLNAKISVEQSLIKEYKQKIDELEANNEKLDKELDSVQTNKTIAETNYNNANKTTGELREEVNRLTLQIEKSVAQLNETLQKQTKAETELTEANKLIAELKEKESEAKKKFIEYEGKLEILRSTNNEVIQKQTKATTELSKANDAIKELQTREAEINNEKSELLRESTLIKEENAELRAKYQETNVRLTEQQIFIEQANEKLKEAFNSLSAEALKNNNESFVTLAKSTLETQVTEAKGIFEKKEQAIGELVKPLSETLNKFDTKIQDLEKIRLEQHGQINQYIQGVQQSTEKLQKETNSLVTALKTSHGRGRYGEIALRRVVEVAGMTEHCDFEEQVSVSDEDGRVRPDMIIRLPERKIIVVDSKVPLAAYMRAFETENEEERKMFLSQHASAVREHLKRLSAKAYWSQFAGSPDYVVLYMQIESSFGAALQTDPTLVEDGIRNKIIFATPTTLITLLRTVGFVWQQVSIAENIEQIRDAGIELYNRTTVLLKHFSSMGASLKTSVTHYNSAVASLESRFIPQAKKLYALGSAYTKNALPEIEQVELTVRELIVENRDEHTEETIINTK